MSDPKVPRHYIVAPWTATDPTVNSGLGQVGPPYSQVYANIADAKAMAQQQAALQPGSVWVVYSAVWYAWTDETPVNLRPVVGATIG